MRLCGVRRHAAAAAAALASSSCCTNRSSMDKRTGGWKKPATAMLFVDVVFGIVNILIKSCLDRGLSCLVLVSLRQLTAAAFLAPIAYLRERKRRPKLTGRAFLYIFISALLGGTLTQYLFFVGLQFTSATFACAFLNMMPVLTFLVALPFGMETMNLRSTGGKGKVVATITCLSGAMLLILYKGMALTYTSKAEEALAASLHDAPSGGNNKALKWTIGLVALFGSIFSWTGWFLVQSKVMKHYPVIYSATSIMFFLGGLQGVVVTFAIQRDASVWLLKGKLELITILISGVVASGMGTLTMTWCLSKKGPVFTSAFTPLIQIIVTIADFLLLQEPLYLGSVLGSLLVISGLYVLLWSKNKEVDEPNSLIKVIESSDNGASNQCHSQEEPL